MYLKSLMINNFRKFGTENNKIEFVDAKGYKKPKEGEVLNIAPMTTLIVGKNNSGKTTIITLLDKLINNKKFNANDFNFSYLKELLEKYALKINHDFFIGYFGDAVQNIYDEGIGERINELHSGLKRINKEFNRRSTEEVISVINNIRNDCIKQISIYEDSQGGVVEFYSGNNEVIRSFIDKCILDWDISSENQLHCLVLTNQSVAEFSGFDNIYTNFKKTGYYKKYYNQLNTELLNKDFSKLGEIPNLLFRIIKLRNDIKNPKTSLDDILSLELYENMSITDLRNLFELFNNIRGNTLQEYIYSISKIYIEENNLKYNRLIDKTFDFKGISIEVFKNHIIEKLYPNLNEDASDDAYLTVQALLDIGLDEYDLWYNFIMDKQDGQVIYHTYHGTKGLEFKNTVIIMQNDFGILDKNKFNSYFTQFNRHGELNGDEKEKFEKTRNLLYVSCSRAIKNLRILYIDNISEFETNIRKIFGQIYQYP